METHNLTGASPFFQALLRKVREDHASRQRSNLEGGRRMVIEEVDDDEFEFNDTEKDYEEGDEKSAGDGDGTQNQSIPLKQGVEIEEVFDESEQESSENEVS